jgi:hypothetical protein
MGRTPRERQDMTRKDYEAIAEVLREHREASTNKSEFTQLCYSLADKFTEENPRFLPHRFLGACGVFIGHDLNEMITEAIAESR